MTSSRPPSAVDPKFFNDSSLVLLSPVSGIQEFVNFPIFEIMTVFLSGSGQDHLASSTEPSPVIKPSPKLKSLHAVLKSSALLEYTNGVFVRLALPKLYSSSLIQRCFGALKLCINDKDACHRYVSKSNEMSTPQ